MEIFKVKIPFSKLFDFTKRFMHMKTFGHVTTTTTRLFLLLLNHPQAEQLTHIQVRFGRKQRSHKKIRHGEF